jgi:hypothetical protein
VIPGAKIGMFRNGREDLQAFLLAMTTALSQTDLIGAQ